MGEIIYEILNTIYRIKKNIIGIYYLEKNYGEF